jgi:phosphohistidine phosphatase SixA
LFPIRLPQTIRQQGDAVQELGLSPEQVLYAQFVRARLTLVGFGIYPANRCH